MDWLTIVVDGLWIAALAIMSGASRQAYGRMLPTAKAPMHFGLKGQPGWRAPRLLAVVLTPALATALWLILIGMGQSAPAGSSERIMMIGLRLFLAPVFALVHLWHMRQALKVLAAEGQLRS